METVYLREDALKLLNSPLRFYFYVVETTVFPFLVLVAMARFLHHRRRKWLFVFVATLIVAVLYAGMTTEKEPTAEIFLLMLVFLYVWKRGVVSGRALGLGVLSFLAFPLLVVSLQTSGTRHSFLDNIADICNRIFYAPAQVVYYYFEVFPDKVPYQYGATIGKLALLIGRTPTDAGNVVGLYMAPGTISSVHANAAFIGNLNADFGLLGVVVGGFLAGVLMQTAQVYLLRQPKTIYNVTLYAFLMLKFSFICFTALLVVLLSDGVFISLGLAWAVQSLERVFWRRPSARTAQRPLGWTGAQSRQI